MGPVKLIACFTKKPMNLHVEKTFFSAYWRKVKFPFLLAFKRCVSRSTVGAIEMFAVHFSMEYKGRPLVRSGFVFVQGV
jgi:hypothetical protein